MKKIIWISSYPKSGNTWVRFFLANYFYNARKKNIGFSLLKNIDKFPQQKYLQSIADSYKLSKNPYSVSDYWLKIQTKITSTNENFVFLKNHNALVEIEGKEFTNERFSLGIIYIVRDPRDILLSYLNFDRNLSASEVYNRLVNKNLYCHVSRKNPFDIEILGSWKFNYNSWRDGCKAIPRLIIKYEDLITNTYNTKLQMLNFLSKIINFEINYDQLNFAIEQSKFNNLVALEKNHGFDESKNTFFNTGKSGNWKSKDEYKNFYEEIYKFAEYDMKELGYK